MKTQLLTALALLTATLASSPSARACGGVDAGNTRMCVALPATVSTFLQHEQVLDLAAEAGHIEFLTTDESTVMVGTTKRHYVGGTVIGQQVTGVGVYPYRTLLSGWFVRIGEYRGLVKLLTSLQFRGLLPKLRAEGARLTSLYAMTDGSGLVRVNGTDAGAYSIVGVMSPTGELSGIEIRR